MEKKGTFLSIIFMVSILFAMLFPSFHATQHFIDNAEHNICENKQENKHEVTALSSDIHHCFACDFTLHIIQIPNYLEFNFFAFQNYNTSILDQFTFFSNFFKGSTYLLRGPPTL